VTHLTLFEVFISEFSVTDVSVIYLKCSCLSENFQKFEIVKIIISISKCVAGGSAQFFFNFCSLKFELWSFLDFVSF
jgi:hypothetical protein